jgi:hypothetical protein
MCAEQLHNAQGGKTARVYTPAKTDFILDWAARPRGSANGDEEAESGWGKRRESQEKNPRPIRAIVAPAAIADTRKSRESMSIS